MNVYDQLIKAQLEVLANNPTAGVEGRVIYNSTAKKAYIDNGTVWKDLGGGGGMNIIWRNDDTMAAGEETYYGCLAYTFTSGDSQTVYTAFKVPNGYAAGAQIKLKIKIASPTAGASKIKMQTTATLIRSGTDALSSTTNQNISSVESTINTANLEYVCDMEITSSTGQINSVAVSANDTIIIGLTRIAASSAENADDAYFMPSTSEVLI